MGRERIWLAFVAGAWMQREIRRAVCMAWLCVLGMAATCWLLLLLEGANVLVRHKAVLIVKVWR